MTLGHQEFPEVGQDIYLKIIHSVDIWTGCSTSDQQTTQEETLLPSEKLVTKGVIELHTRDQRVA